VIQKNRAKIIPDERNGSYILKFVSVTWQDGTEKEDEITRLVFLNKADLLEFTDALVEGLKKYQ